MRTELEWAEPTGRSPGGRNVPEDHQNVAILCAQNVLESDPNVAILCAQNVLESDPNVAILRAQKVLEALLNSWTRQLNGSIESRDRNGKVGVMSR